MHWFKQANSDGDNHYTLVWEGARTRITVDRNHGDKHGWWVVRIGDAVQYFRPTWNIDSLMAFIQGSLIDQLEADIQRLKATIPIKV